MIHTHQRGLIHTENKPLGRLCKMCNPFFYEFQGHSEAESKEKHGVWDPMQESTLSHSHGDFEFGLSTAQ